jgi:hypothetical protein
LFSGSFLFFSDGFLFFWLLHDGVVHCCLCFFSYYESNLQSFSTLFRLFSKVVSCSLVFSAL